MKALVDGDVLRYRIGFACETTIYGAVIKGEEEWGARASFPSKKALKEWVETWKLEEDDYTIITHVEPEPIAHCLHSVKLQMDSIIKGAGADDFQVYLSGAGNYRDKIATVRPYKGNRPDRKPYHYNNITDYLINNYGAIIVEGQEADDAMSIEQYEDYDLTKSYCTGHEWGGCEPELHLEMNTIICTIDKDLDCCPGWHYNFVKDIKYWVDEWTATTWFYCQMIMGDQTDNIQGIAGAGKKKAYEVLKECQTELEMYKAVAAEYQRAYVKGEEVLLEMGRLLWMRRREDELWTPPIQYEEYKTQ